MRAVSRASWLIPRFTECCCLGLPFGCLLDQRKQTANAQLLGVPGSKSAGARHKGVLTGETMKTVKHLKRRFFRLSCEAGLGDCTAEARPSTGSGRGEPVEPRRARRKSNKNSILKNPLRTLRL